MSDENTWPDTAAMIRRNDPDEMREFLQGVLDKAVGDMLDIDVRESVETMLRAQAIEAGVRPEDIEFSWDHMQCTMRMRVPVPQWITLTITKAGDSA